MKIYNTMSSQKEEFKELEKGKVKMYSCGPTVYNYFHIGNARPFIVFDTLRNYLEYIGYEVTFVQNFTDVDDKIIIKANEEGITPIQLADKYIEEYFKDAKAIGIRKATVHPRVTENIKEIIDFIQDLIDKGFAYVLGNDVYFEVKKFKEYGKLSHKNIDDLLSGARIEINDEKRAPIDFALWKGKKEGEIGWDSPWGQGRPGWHIECSVMSNKYLGESIDIHSGGQDLIFPHHENEIAQSEARSSHTFANYWMHNGYINVDNEKMSKSLGNFFTVRDVLKEFDGDTLRFFMLSAHYRSPINYSKDMLNQAKSSLERIKNCKNNLNFILTKIDKTDMSEQEKENVAYLQECKTNFIDKMNDDLNTADAITAIFDLVKFANTNVSIDSSKVFVQQTLDMLNELTGVLNIAMDKADEDVDVAKIEELIEQRNIAKKSKDFAKADTIRDELKQMGIEIKDTRQGVQWSRI
ncbi:cysteinyl-tRNA synthetase [Peptoanaerobacter stomatis]|uniref:Cysteine--tRNA ligase n=1 Tax=Peptoanaerobacter stomatis TaxID=796937 RepID=G9XEZ1_9FIRM|nr:cysteine--tRNA ligase [Peptoanaerobacter stomatis]EHL17890.1 cysteinyl-tRNA synthetase [Peptoanaerobacter stomatis]